MTANRPGSVQIPADASPVEAWWLTLRSQTMRQLPVESALSWPVPLVRDGQLYLAAFYYGVRRVAGPGTGLALPPIARVVASYPAGRLMSFVHRQLTDLFPGLPSTGELGPLVAVQQPPTERMRDRKALFALYSPILDQYHKGAQEHDQRQAFQVAFMRLAEPGLLPYYWALNPDFFEWLAR
jgi:hypothetical protein